MKLPVIFATLLFGFLSFSQEKTYTKSELDSMSLEDSFSNKGLINSVQKDTTSFKIIENVPVYKGCEKEKGNTAKKNCMSLKISELFKQHFNTTLPEDSKVPSGKTRIFLSFHVDKDGSIVDSIARGPDKYLENEALRVLKFIPKLIPGFQKGEPVKVPYSLPLIVMIENKNDTKANFIYPVFRGCDENMTNAELKKCSQEKIKNFIKMSFDTGKADVALPLEKSTKFQLDFIINKKGKVEQVNAKANHRAIAIEAIKVAKRIPKFKKPGTSDGKAVEVPYSLLMTIYF